MWALPGIPTPTAPNPAAEEVRSHGRKAVVKQLDYTDLPACGVTIDLMIDELGGLDVFVNNAGTGSSAFLVDTSYDEWRRSSPPTWTAPSCLRQRRST